MAYVDTLEPKEKPTKPRKDPPWCEEFPEPAPRDRDRDAPVPSPEDYGRERVRR